MFISTYCVHFLDTTLFVRNVCKKKKKCLVQIFTFYQKSPKVTVSFLNLYCFVTLNIFRIIKQLQNVYSTVQKEIFHFVLSQNLISEEMDKNSQKKHLYNTFSNLQMQVVKCVYTTILLICWFNQYSNVP